MVARFARRENGHTSRSISKCVFGEESFVVSCPRRQFLNNFFFIITKNSQVGFDEALFTFVGTMSHEIALFLSKPSLPRHILDVSAVLAGDRECFRQHGNGRP